MAFLNVVSGRNVSRSCRPMVRPVRRTVVVAAASKDAVMDLILSQDNFERLQGVNLARELEPSDCLNALSVTSIDPDLNVRYATVSQLAVAGQADPPKALELLRSLVDKETDTSVKAAVADAMCAIGLQEVGRKGRSLIFGGDAKEEKDGKVNARSFVSNGLFRVWFYWKAYDDVEKIFEESGDIMVRFSILAGLGELGNPRAFDLLKSVLEDDSCDDLLKVAAIGALGELGDSRAVDVVKPFLESEDASLRERAIVSMNTLQA